MGRLYVVPTPVGNLEDITLRAIRVLKEADLILAEDTRTSGILLKHYGIKNAMQSHHKFNEHQTVEGIVSRIKGGENVALISDAGTPAISDPGFLIVRECVRNGVDVQCLPGAQHLCRHWCLRDCRTSVSALKDFFLRKKGRMTRLNALKDETRTMVFYESPYRLVKTLSQFAEYFGMERPVAICRKFPRCMKNVSEDRCKKLLRIFRKKNLKVKLS